MASPRRQDRDIASFQSEFAAGIATETDPGVAAGDAERFMDRVMVVEVVKYTVAPHLAPTVRTEQAFDRFLRTIPKTQYVLVNQKWQRIVRHQSVVGKDECLWFDCLADRRHGPCSCTTL